MTTKEISNKIKRVVDQFYASQSDKYIQDAQLHYIGGIMQCALFLLPNKDYFEMKEYIYQKHGYDPGGVKTGQMALNDYKWMEVDNEPKEV